MSSNIHDLLARAKTASRGIRTAPHEQRLAILESVALALEAERSSILEENQADVDGASDLSSALMDRLRLSPERVDAFIRAVREVAKQPDPLAGWREIGVGQEGVRVTRQRVPLGVIAIVYEARPNVTAECAALTIKSGNAVVLRGGKEALRSNLAIAHAVRRGIEAAGANPNLVCFVEDTERKTVVDLLGAVGQIDLVIPRGGPNLMAIVDEHARVPVIRHGQGICQVYVDAKADAEMAIRIAINAKVQRPGVCNAMETLLVHESRLDEVLPELGRRLLEHGVELRADPASRAALARAGLSAQSASPQDWDTEFLGLTLAVRAVQTLESALEHIEAHGTHHTAAIVTEDETIARRFLDQVDASCVLWNASTRFNDGGALGLGAEMGISTSKMHAYGPMSATELTAEKLVVYGSGQVRS